MGVGCYWVNSSQDLSSQMTRKPNTQNRAPLMCLSGQSALKVRLAQAARGTGGRMGLGRERFSKSGGGDGGGGLFWSNAFRSGPNLGVGGEGGGGGGVGGGGGPTLRVVVVVAAAAAACFGATFFARDKHCASEEKVVVVVVVVAAAAVVLVVVRRTRTRTRTDDHLWEFKFKKSNGLCAAL